MHTPENYAKIAFQNRKDWHANTLTAGKPSDPNDVTRQWKN